MMEIDKQGAHDEATIKNNDDFKSLSTNMFLFSDENNQFSSDWNKPGLLKFPKLKPQLKQEAKMHREIYKEIVEKFESRRIEDLTYKIKRYDVEINLQRMLYKNDKYLGLCRNRHRESSIFGNKSLKKLNLGQMMNDEGILNSCRRFEQYSKRFEERCLNDIFEANIYRDDKNKNKFESDKHKEKLEEEEEDKRNYYNSSSEVKLNKSQSLKLANKPTVKQLTSESVSDFHLNAGRTSTMIESNNPSSLRNNDSRLNTQSMIKSNVNAMLKPKKQVVIAATVKNKIILPPIDPKATKKEKGKDNYEDDFEDEVLDDDEDFM